MNTSARNMAVKYYKRRKVLSQEFAHTHTLCHNVCIFFPDRAFFIFLFVLRATQTETHSEISGGLPCGCIYQQQQSVSVCGVEHPH